MNLNFSQLARAAIVTLTEGGAKTLTKRQVMTEAAAKHRSSGYVLDSLRMDRAAARVLRESCISRKVGSTWEWAVKDSAKGQDWADSAKATVAHCNAILEGGFKNAADKEETGALVDTGMGWKAAEKQVKAERKAREAEGDDS